MNTTTQKRAAALLGVLLVAGAGGIAGAEMVQANTRVEEALHTELHTHTVQPDGGGLLFLANQVSRITGQTPQPQAAPAPSALLTNWPLSHTDSPDVLNSYFGPRWRISQNAYEFHPGIDLAAPYGTAVYAAKTGKVRLLTDATGCKITTPNTTAPAGCTPSYPGGGMIVQLDHGNNVYTNYLHLSSQTSTLKMGDTVNAGVEVGKVGHTGNTSFDHLHFEVRDGSYYSNDVKNPLPYLPRPVASNVAPTVSALSHTANANSTYKVTGTVQALPADLDINHLTLTVRNNGGTVVSQTEVDFNDRVNVGTTTTTNGVTFNPAPFNDSSSILTINVSFNEVSIPAGGSYQLTVADVSGLNSSKQNPLP